MSILDRIALLLTVIGGINWGLVGIFRFDLVAWICGGQDAIIARIVYTLVGIAALWCISLIFRDRDPVQGKGRSRNRRPHTRGAAVLAGSRWLSVS